MSRGKGLDESKCGVMIDIKEITGPKKVKQNATADYKVKAAIDCIDCPHGGNKLPCELKSSEIRWMVNTVAPTHGDAELDDNEGEVARMKSNHKGKVLLTVTVHATCKASHDECTNSSSKEDTMEVEIE